MAGGGTILSRRRFTALSLASALTACSQGERIVLRAADTHVATYPTVQAVRAMGEMLARETDGRISITPYPGRQLGEEKDTLEQTVFGAVDLNRINMTTMTSVIPETSVLSLPFVFRSIAHRDAVLNGPVGEDILALFEPYGLIGLAFYDSGARSLYATRPVTSPADMAGLRIRVQNSDVAVAMIEALGGNATPMEFGQVYEAIRNGTVDGAENNWPSYYDTRHYEVATHYTLTEHSMVPEVLVMSKRRWERFSEEDQALIRHAARHSVKVMSRLWAVQVSEAQSAIAAAGVSVTEVDKAPFMKAVEPVYARFAADPASAALLARIRGAGA